MSVVVSPGGISATFCKVNQLSTDLQYNWKSSYCSVEFQSNVGVASETEGGLGISFFSTAVSAARESTAGSGTSGMVVDDSWDQC